MRQLAELDRTAAKLARAADTRAKELKTEESALGVLRAELDAFTQQLKLLQARLHTRELELKSVEQQIARNEDQKLQLKSKADLDRMDGQIAGRRIEASAIESAILESMELAERVEKELAGRRAVLAEKEARHGVRREKAATEAAEAAVVLTRLPAERADVSNRVSAEVRMAYESARQSAGDHGLSALGSEGFCTACGTRLTPQLQSGARAGKLPPCPGCARLLAAE